jgi:hypothetical protein
MGNAQISPMVKRVFQQHPKKPKYDAPVFYKCDQIQTLSQINPYGRLTQSFLLEPPGFQRKIAEMRPESTRKTV